MDYNYCKHLHEALKTWCVEEQEIIEITLIAHTTLKLYEDIHNWPSREQLKQTSNIIITA